MIVQHNQEPDEHPDKVKGADFGESFINALEMDRNQNYT